MVKDSAIKHVICTGAAAICLMVACTSKTPSSPTAVIPSMPEEQADWNTSSPVRPTPTPAVSTVGTGESAHWQAGTLYLTIISHNEQPSNSRPDYLRDADYYLENRKLMVQLVEMLTDHDAAYNFQSDWNFLQAVESYDEGAVLSDTAGLNLLRWMAETQGVEIDPHAHETHYNYADVAYLIERLGVPPTHTVGGFLYDPPDNPQGWEKHRDGLTGQIYPDYFWQAQVLWGASTSLHQGNDDSSSGVWIPRERDHFYEHDPAGSLIYLGGCTGDTIGVSALLDAIQSEAAPSDGFYTASIVLVQDHLTDQSIRQLETFITQLESQVQAGAVQWVHLSEVVDMWKADYQAMPFQYSCQE